MKFIGVDNGRFQFLPQVNQQHHHILRSTTKPPILFNRSCKHVIPTYITNNALVLSGLVQTKRLS